MTDRYRRQQRRRAVLGWGVGGLVVALFVVGAILGGGEDRNGGQRPDPFGYSMTARQYAALRPGLEENLFVDRLEQTGLPENLTKERYTRLFPAHGDDVTCSYWDIAGQEGLLARVCFSSPAGRLVQKLERRAGSEFGVSA